MVDGTFLIMARQAQAPSQPVVQTETTYSLRVKLKDKAATDELTNSLKKDKANLVRGTKVTTSEESDEVPSGKFFVAIELDAGDAATVAHTLQIAHNQVVTEDVGGGNRRVRLQRVFDSQAEAQTYAKKTNASVSGIVNMQVEEGRKKSAVTVYVLEITVADESSLDEVKQYVVGKTPAGAVQQ